MPILLICIVVSSCGDGKPKTLRVGGADPDYKTIGEAVEAACSGDVVLVAPGTYEESLDISKGLQIVGQGSCMETILSWSRGNVITVRDGELRLIGLSILQKGKKGHGVEVEGGNVTIEDCALNCSSADAALTGMGPRAVLTVRRSRISESPESGGIYAYGSAKVLAEGNDVSGCRYGIVSRAHADLVIRKCTIRDCLISGVWIVEDGHAMIEDNTTARIQITATRGSRCTGKAKQR